MKSNRRNFLKTATAGAGAFAGSFLAGCAPKSPESQLSAILDSTRKNYVQKFNMSGYAAPPVPTVRVGFIGLGDRGSGAVQRLSYIEGVEIKALGDMRPAAVGGSQKYLSRIGRPEAMEFTGDENIWQKRWNFLILTLTPFVHHGPCMLPWLSGQWRTESMLPVKSLFPEQSTRHGSLLKHQREQRNTA